MQFQSPYAKAIVGAFIAALTALGTALADGSVTAAEVVGVLLAGMVTLGGVYTVPNLVTSAATGATTAVTPIAETVTDATEPVTDILLPPKDPS